MLRDTTFVAAVCDRCGDSALAEDSNVLYCRNKANLLALVTSGEPPLLGDAWVPVADAGLLCPACYADLRCAENGHSWEPWRACLCVQGFRIGGEMGACNGQARGCRVCLAVELDHPVGGGAR